MLDFGFLILTRCSSIGGISLRGYSNYKVKKMMEEGIEIGEITVRLDNLGDPGSKENHN